MNDYKRCKLASSAELVRLGATGHGHHRDTATASRHQAVQRDHVLGSVAVGALLALLAWVITGMQLFAVVALLVAAGFFAITFARTVYQRLDAPQFGEQAVAALPTRLRHSAETRSDASMRMSHDNADDKLDACTFYAETLPTRPFAGEAWAAKRDVGRQSMPEQGSLKSVAYCRADRDFDEVVISGCSAIWKRSNST